MIRFAAEEDIPRILEIEREAISPPWPHGALLREIYNDDSVFAVWEADTIPIPPINTSPVSMPHIIEHTIPSHPAFRILGFIILRRAADEGELFQIAVDAAYRRRGVADALVETALNWADGCGVRQVYLEVRKSNGAAIALYNKHGFMQAGLRKEYFTEPAEDAVIMVHRL